MKPSKKSPIFLFLNYWNDKHDIRNKELESAILDNAANRAIDKIILVHDNNTVVKVAHEKIESYKFEWRPSYYDFFHIMNYFLTGAEIGILANTDVVFDDTLALVHAMELDGKVAELSRYERNGRIMNTGEDAWIFKGKVSARVWGHFHLGQLGCDWRITKEFMKYGYKVVNPSLDIKIHHRHDSMIRNYANQNKLCHEDMHTIPATIEKCNN